MERFHVTANGLRVCYFAHGPANGRPTILLHGAGGNGRWWDETAQFLAEGGRRVYAPDLRGHGDTSGPATPLDTETTLADLLALADALEVERALWMGHSWTGKVLFALGARHPARAERLVLIDPAAPAGWGRHRDRMLQWGRELWSQEVGPHNSPETATATLRQLESWRNWQALGGAFQHGFQARADGSLIAKASLETVLTILDALDTNLEPLLPQIEVPTLIVAAAERERSLGAVAALMPRANLAVIAANHWVYTDNPNEFHQALDQHGALS